MRIPTDPRLIRKRRGRRPSAGVGGFTLIELLVVMGIIAILVVVALPRYHGARERAFRAAMQSDLKNLVSAQEAYFDTNYTYASDVAQLEYNKSDGVSVVVIEALGTGWSATANHVGTVSECGVYTGTATPLGTVPDEGEGVITCTPAS